MTKRSVGVICWWTRGNLIGIPCIRSKMHVGFVLLVWLEIPVSCCSGGRLSATITFMSSLNELLVLIFQPRVESHWPDFGVELDGLHGNVWGNRSGSKLAAKNTVEDIGIESEIVLGVLGDGGKVGISR